jgi:hypothetical protein
MSSNISKKSPLPAVEQDTASVPSNQDLLQQSRGTVFTNVVTLVLENKGGVGKSRIAEILYYTLTDGEDPAKKVLVAETDSANRTMKMVGVSEFIDLSLVEWTGKLEYIGERIAAGEFVHAVIDCGARDETSMRAFLPEYAQFLAMLGVRLVVVRPLTLSTFVQNNAYRFVTKVKTDDMSVIAVRNLSQGRTLAMFGSWLAKHARKQMLSAGVIEIDMQDAGPRWSDEAIGYGLSFADIVFGRYDKIKDDEDRNDAIAVFERPIQLFLGRWLRAQAQTFGDALKAATGAV